MFSLGKRMSTDGNFKSRVEEFWSWFASRAEEFYAAIEAGKCPDLEPEVSAITDQLFPGLGWVFGPGPNKEGHSFTLTPEGDPHRRLLTAYWHKHAPDLPGWTFHPSRQASPDVSGWAIQMHDHEVATGEIWITLDPDPDLHVINLTAWHPMFGEAEEHAAYQVLFIMLDEALGEDCVAQQIGSVALGNDKLEHSVPLDDLAEEIAKSRAQWKEAGQEQAGSVYQLHEPDNRFPRSDTIVGTTTHLPIMSLFLESEGNLEEDPLEDLGAEFLFLAFDVSFLPEGEQADARHALELAIEEDLDDEQLGTVLGGAYGMEQAYIDLLVYDRDAALECLGKTLRGLGFPKSSAIYPFVGNCRLPLVRI